MIEEVYEKDKVKFFTYNGQPSSVVIHDKVFIFPFGLCFNIVDYDPNEDITLSYPMDITTINVKFEYIYVFVTDPTMLSFSGLDLQSHKGTHIFGMKRNHKVIHNVQVVIKDFDNPVEREFCSLTSYADCVDDNIHTFFSEVSAIFSKGFI